MTMTDLVAWLRQQLDTDDLEATHGWDFIEENSVRGPGWGHAWCRTCGWESFGATEPNAKYAWSEHATQMHNPARVLRQVQAHRAILDHLERELADHGGDNPWWYADRLTPILRALASIYSDRDGWQEEWSA